MTFDEQAGHASYEAFIQAMAAWAPDAPSWEKLPEHLRNGWIAAARAAARAYGS